MFCLILIVAQQVTFETNTNTGIQLFTNILASPETLVFEFVFRVARNIALFVQRRYNVVILDRSAAKGIVLISIRTDVHTNTEICTFCMAKKSAYLQISPANMYSEDSVSLVWPGLRMNTKYTMRSLWTAIMRFYSESTFSFLFPALG